MNAAEIKTRITDLENATKQNLPADAIVDILTSLQKEVKITEKLLRVRYGDWVRLGWGGVFGNGVLYSWRFRQ